MTENESRILLITGAAGGIGRATVKVFADEGWKVIGVDRAPKFEAFPQNGIYIFSEM